MSHSKESYKHLFAKNILADWLQGYYLKIRKEVQFCEKGDILFIADVVCYTENGITDVYEVVHKNGLDSKKLGIMQYYQYLNGYDFNVYEVQSEVILMQIQKPKYIKKIDFSCYTTYANNQHKIFCKS